jgi:hypothetical protein
MAMKRLILLLACAIAVPAFALTRPPRPGDRIGVLRMSDRYTHGPEQTVAKTVQADLRNELRDRGFDAFDARVTFDELRRGTPNADYYVEIVSSHTLNHPIGGVGAGQIGIAVEVAVVVSRVAAEMRLYDGRTLDLIESYDLRKDKTAVVPAAIGMGNTRLWLFAAIPFLQYGQYRAAAHEVAAEGAARIAGR